MTNTLDLFVETLEHEGIEYHFGISGVETIYYSLFNTIIKEKTD